MANQTEFSYKLIKEKILEGVYKPSENLVEINLASELGVSRNTIKKALLMLSSEGLVDMQDNKGAKVRSFTLEEVLNYYEIREVLEGYIARITAPLITSDELESLYQTLLKMEYCIQQGDLTQYSNHNIEFHNIIYETCKNKQAVEMVTSIKTQMRRYHFRTILVLGRNANSFNEHKSIFNALKEHNAEEAERLTKLHIANVREILKKNYQFLI